MKSGSAFRPNHAHGMVLVVLLCAGCATTPEPRTAGSDEGLPLNAAFLYQEKVHSAGGAFSLAECYWDHGFPIMATAFQDARQYADQWTALQSADSEAIVLVENMVYGSAEGHKFSMTLSVKSRDNKTVMTKSIQQQVSSLKNCSETMSGMATAMKEALQRSATLGQFARKRAAAE